MSFDTKLKELRNKFHLTQAELATTLGLQRSTVTQYESGRISPSKDVLIKVADYFRISVDELLSTTDQIENENVLTETNPSDKAKKGNDYTSSVRNIVSQKIIAKLYQINQDSFILENKNLFLRLFDVLLEINMKSEDSDHEYIKIHFANEELDINKIIMEFSKELRKLENLSNLFD